MKGELINIPCSAKDFTFVSIYLVNNGILYLRPNLETTVQLKFLKTFYLLQETQCGNFSGTNSAQKNAVLVQQKLLKSLLSSAPENSIWKLHKYKFCSENCHTCQQSQFVYF